MIVLGLTGSIGMGKSTVGAMFAEEGVPVFDADAVVHRLQGRKGALVAEIETLFPGTTGAAGVNRTALAEAVLGERSALRRLEALIHPAVAREKQAFLAEHRGRSEERRVGKSVSVRVDIGGRRIIKKRNTKQILELYTL